jgi:AraC family transcriptional regulator
MNAQLTNVEIRSDNSNSDSSGVAARLVEAARFAREGNSEAAKDNIERALALLRGDPSSIPENMRQLNGGAQAVVRGGLVAWQKRRLTTYIDVHLSGRIRVVDLAGLLKLSASHFSRTFRLTFGTTPHEYLLRRRIEVAQSLMLTTCAPLSAIALHCGLSDQSHLCRAFRRIVGETPLAWRRMRSGDIEDGFGQPSSDPAGLARRVNPEECAHGAGA